MREDLFPRQIDLRIEIRHAELAPTPAARRHLDDAERRALVGEDDLVPALRMVHVNRQRELLTAQRLVEQRQRLGRFAPSFDDTVNAQFLIGVVLADLPAARAANYYVVLLPPGVVLDRREHLAGVV